MSNWRAASDRRSRYGVELLGYAVDPRDAHVLPGQRAVRYHVRWRDPDGTEKRSVTRGAMLGRLSSLTPGDTVAIIRDGNGAIIHVERRDPA